MRTILLFLLYALCDVNGKSITKMRDCMKRWQQVLMTIETVSRPSSAVQCHPDTNPCPGGGECQFSFKGFKFVCCEDRKDIRVPVCPKFHDTLRVMCGRSGEARCPGGFDCMASRFDADTKICCRLNPGLKYPEPETGFIDHYITPEVLPVAPKNEVQIAINGINLEPGQMIQSADLQNQENPPSLGSFNGSSDALYTVMLFDMSVEKPVELYWFVSNVRYNNGSLDLANVKDRSARHLIRFHAPREVSGPEGVHILVAAVFQQTERWNEKRWPAVSDHAFNVKDWIAEAGSLIDPVPVAGNYFGFRSTHAKTTSAIDED